MDTEFKLMIHTLNAMDRILGSSTRSNCAATAPQDERVEPAAETAGGGHSQQDGDRMTTVSEDKAACDEALRGLRRVFDL